jgi:hypothetical protein
MNSNIKTQLLSKSLQAVLNRCVDGNELAAVLFTLNHYEYYDDCIRNITVRKEDQEMSFVPAGKSTILTPEGLWSKELRQTGKYGKVLRKVISSLAPHKTIVDKDLEELVNIIKASFSPGAFELVSGEDIRDAYNGNNYNFDESLGSLGESCMRHDRCQDYFDIYVNNPDVVSMLVLRSGMGILGRALVWKTDSGITFMDRIYGSDSTMEKFKGYAKEKGWYYKKEQSYHSPQRFGNPDGDYESLDLQVQLSDSSGSGYYPYLDTMCFHNNDRGILYNYNGEGASRYLRDTSGNYECGMENALNPNTFLFEQTDSPVYIDSVHGYIPSSEVTYCYYSQTDIFQGDAVDIACGVSIHSDYVGLENDNITLLSDGRQARSSRVRTCGYSAKVFLRSEVNFIDEIEMYVHDSFREEAIGE